MAMADVERAILGRVIRPLGLHGWLTIFSHTDPPDKIASYSLWHLGDAAGWHQRELCTLKWSGKRLLAKLDGCDDRNQAERLTGCQIAVPVTQLDTLPAGQYYWRDLEGLQVATLDGQVLGRVDYLFSAGAGDVMAVAGDRQRLIPWRWQETVKSVDLTTKQICVDWDVDF